MSRERLTRAFLWLSVIGWGIGMGAKLFDLLVLAGAWSAAPPASFALLPYGPPVADGPRGFFPALERADGGGDAGSTHQWMEDPA